MAFQTSITDILNQWADFGVFAYLIPFLLIFAVVYAILDKTQLLGENRPVEAIIALAIGLLALQFDFVSTFFAEIFPRFGVGLAVFLVLVILIGFFYQGEETGKLKWIGFVTGIGVVVWALVNWNFWSDNFSIGNWLGEYFWSLIVLGGVIALIFIVATSGKDRTPTTSIPVGAR
jgi:hypothetical protein